MRVEISTTLPCPYERAVAEVQKPRLLEFVAYPLVRFVPLEPAQFPETWSEGIYWVGLRIGGWLPLGRQAIGLSFPALPTGFALRDDGHSALLKTWDHLITIEPAGEGICYRDTIEVRAGVLTPLVCLLAWCFYRHRQRRWRKLVARDFRYDGR